MSTPSENIPKGSTTSGTSSSGTMGNKPSGSTRPNTGSGSMEPTASSGTTQQVTEAAKQAAQTAKEKTGEVAQEITEQVKKTAGDVSREVSQQVSATMDEAKRKVEESATTQKEQLADRIAGVADALHQAGDGLERGQENQLGSYASSAADQLTGLSDYLRDHDLGQILDDARHYARQQPEIFYVGALVAGFLTGRFFRSSGTQPSYGSGYGPNYGPNRNPNYSPEYRRNYEGGYGGSYERPQGASYGQGYGPTRASGPNRQQYPQPVPVTGPKGESKTEEIMPGQVATAWTPAEQALHARSDEE